MHTHTHIYIYTHTHTYHLNLISFLKFFGISFEYK